DNVGVIRSEKRRVLKPFYKVRSRRGFVDVTRFYLIQRSFEGIQIAGILISVSFSGIYFFSGQFVKWILILPFFIYLQSKFKKFRQNS
ncbi:hypothetical protein, partial [Pseudoalteromonas rubra]|uniref:hypothetical protein n=1 Tax=Pseudoalteromonas rubra TaxID=43658 RepID=UPI001F0C7D0A